MTTKEEYLTQDILSLQKHIVEKTKKKESLESDIKRLHRERADAEARLRNPMVDLESALHLLRVESESLVAQIEARKKEIGSLERHHSVVHKSHGEKIAKSKSELSVLENSFAAKQDAISALELIIKSKRKEIEDLTEKIRLLQFEVENYQKTIIVISNQEKQFISSVRLKAGIEKKLIARIKELRRTHHVLVEDVLTERNKRLWKRHEQRTRMSGALDKQIERKQKLLK